MRPITPRLQMTPGHLVLARPMCRSWREASLQSDTDDVEATNAPEAEGSDAYPREDDSAEKFERTTTPLRPNRVDIGRHLLALFSATFVHDYPDAWIEIAYANPAAGGKPDKAKHFSVFDLEAAAEFAEAKNKAGYNIYVGVALRQGETPSKSNGRASGENVLSASHAWAELDKPGDDARIEAILREKNLPTSMTVVTGRTPHFRAHLYFKLTDRATPEELKNANTALKALLGSDDVQNPDRVLRLAGTINYPPPKKAERGYVPELVTLHIRENATAHTVERLISLAGKPSDATGFNAKSGRSDDELEALSKPAANPANGTIPSAPPLQR